MLNCQEPGEGPGPVIGTWGNSCKAVSRSDMDPSWASCVPPSTGSQERAGISTAPTEQAGLEKYPASGARLLPKDVGGGGGGDM